MKRRILAVLLAAMTLVSGCQTAVESSSTSSAAETEVAAEEKALAQAEGESEIAKQEIGNKLTVADIKEKYESSESNASGEADIMPLYNVAEDEVFDFTFQMDLYEMDAMTSNLVTIHTDSNCEPESEVAAYMDVKEHEQGFTVSLSPVSAVLETVYNEEDEAVNEHAVWGNAPEYYIAIWYDTEAKTEKKLDEPIILPFTIKHKVQAPQVSGRVDANGCFWLEWEPVEGAEEYRIYNLVDGNQWSGDCNEPVKGATTGYMECSLLEVATTTDTRFADFGLDGDDGLVPYERSTSGRMYYIGQNYYVEGEYYVSAVVDGVESGFANAVETADLKIPRMLADEDDIMFNTYQYVSELPETLTVCNIDGSVTERKVLYTFIEEKTWVEGMTAPEYIYEIEGTVLTGCVSMDSTIEQEYPEHIGEATPTGNSEPENNIKNQPEADVETITGEDASEEKNLYERQKENTKKHRENGEAESVEPVEEEYAVFADSAEEEWLALNLINGETRISLEAFPKLQYAKNLEDTFYKVYYQNPYILGVTRFGYDYKTMTFGVEYAYKQDEMKRMQREIYDEAKRVLDEIVTSDMSEQEKQNAIYQYLENNSSYDYAALEDAEKNNFRKTGSNEFEYAFNTYGILVKKVGVCQSYAYVYKLLCSMCGVECNVMTGYLDGSLPHAWNTVKIDGAWYQTDATNNGKVTGIPYFLFNSDSQTASLTGYTEDELFETDGRLGEYESENKEYEYYYANDKYAQDLEEYKTVLDQILEDGQDVICVRYAGDAPDTEEFERAVVEIYARKNMENKLSSISYGITNNFIILKEQ